MIYPWQQQEWQRILAMKASNRLPHALLFSGANGIGKNVFAKSVIRALLCEQLKNNFYCGQCHACRLIDGNAHPNVLWVVPEKEGQAIKIDQVRAANEFIQQSAFSGEYKIAIIQPADSMNLNAANALLKTLEEPSSASILILISDEPQRLPATILSRCQRIQFSLPSKETALTWLEKELKQNADQAEQLLKLSHGAPLAAFQLAKENILTERHDLFNALCDIGDKKKDPVLLAAKVQQALEVSRIIDLSLSWANDLLRLKMQIHDIVNEDYAQALKQFSEKITLEHFMQWLAFMNSLRKKITSGFNLNKQLAIENIFIRWMECFS